MADLTVAEIAERFLDHHSKHSDPGTYTFYARPVNSFATMFGGLRVADVKLYHISEWIDGQNQEGNYRRNLLRAVKSCFKWAEQQEYSTRCPNIRVPAATPRDDTAYLTPAQYERLIAATKNPDLLDAITVLRETGCRPKELRTVEARHLTERCWVFPADEAKGKREPRVVHLSDTVYGICRRATLKRPSGPLFPWSAQRLDKAFQRLSKRVGFKVTPYSLRHSFATEAIIRGVDLQTIATLMGHTSLTMLSRVYQHVRRRADHLQESLRRAVG
jgi:integrase